MKPVKTVITVVCMYCKKYIGTKDGQGVTGVSHGICPACKSKLDKELDEEAQGVK